MKKNLKMSKRVATAGTKTESKTESIKIKNLGSAVVRRFCFVRFEVQVPFGYEKVYLCGNTRNLGEWNATKAVQMRQVGDYFVVRKRFPLGAQVEFKALVERNWGCVEKGIFFEEIGNNVLTAEKGLVYTWHVPTFNDEHFL